VSGSDQGSDVLSLLALLRSNYFDDDALVVTNTAMSV
jgi:hypothetical protein